VSVGPYITIFLSYIQIYIKNNIKIIIYEIEIGRMSVGGGGVGEVAILGG